VAVEAARAVLADNAGHPGHIFNLGHGVLPTSDPGVLAEVVDVVHEAHEVAAW
jgi:uroporphyrinogen decarboxylase